MKMNELERLAASKAKRAILLDRAGSKAEAVKAYREVIGLLMKLVELTDSPVNREVYKERIAAYSRRLKELQEDGDARGIAAGGAGCEGEGRTTVLCPRVETSRQVGRHRRPRTGEGGFEGEHHLPVQEARALSVGLADRYPPLRSTGMREDAAGGCDR
jgi:MIT (microtubule interacting and transport) domain.